MYKVLRMAVGTAFSLATATGCHHTEETATKPRVLSKEEILVKDWRESFCEALAPKRPAPTDGSYSCSVARTWKGSFEIEDFEAEITTGRGTMLTVAKGGVPGVADKLLVGAFTWQKRQWVQVLGNENASASTWKARGFKTGRRVTRNSVIFATAHMGPMASAEKPLEAVAYCGQLPSDGALQKAAKKGKKPKITYLTHCTRRDEGS